MNILPLLTFYFINSQSQFMQRDINQEIAKSLYYVIEKFFMERSTSFVFILSCQREHTMNFYKDLLEVIFGYWGNIKTQIVINQDIPGPAASGERIYNMLLVDSFESFLKIDPASKVKDYDINEYYHVFLQNRDRFLADDIQRILNYCWHHYLINVNIQVQKATGEIIVYTYFPFTAEHCGKVVPVEINRFENGTMRNADLFPQKLTNMFNCSLNVATWSGAPYIILDENNTEVIGGLEGNLLLQLSEMINFHIQIKEPPNQEKRGTISGNVTTGAFKMLQERKADITLGYIWFTDIRAEVATPSNAYYQSANVFVMLGYASYYELIQSKWFPFDAHSSAALLSAFLITLCMLVGLSSMGKLSELFSDLRRRNVVLDHIACTLGLPYFIEPKRNWARIFLMNWMICSLIIRTNYGAMLFHIIRNNLFRRVPSKLEDVVRLNYTYVFNRATLYGLQGTSILNETGLKYIFNPDEKIPTYVYFEDRPYEKLITIAPLESIINYVVLNRKIGALNVFKKTIMSQNCCMYFTKHSFLVDRVNYLIRLFSAVGLLDAWMKKYFDFAYVTSAKTSNNTAIGMQELEGIFHVCGWMLMTSCLIFCLELASLKIKVLRALMKKL